MDYYHHLVTSASFIVQATEFDQLLHHDRTHWTKVYATFNNTNKKRTTGALFLKQLLSVPLLAISTGRLPSNIAPKNLQGIHLPPAELLMVTYFLSLLAHDRLAQQPQSIQTPRLCRTVVSIPHFLCEKGKNLLKSQNEFTKPEQNGWMTALGSHWFSSLLSTRSEISNFFRHQLKPKRGCFCVSFHPGSHHFKCSCCVHSGLLHHSCYCHGLAGWIQPLCCRLCSALWGFDSRVSSKT